MSAFRYTSGSDLTAPSVTRGVLSQAIAYRRAGAMIRTTEITEAEEESPNRR